MGCCLSKEEDQFDGSEALLPKGRNGASNKQVPRSFAASGSWDRRCMTWSVDLHALLLSAYCRQKAFEAVEPVKKDGGNGSYKSPAPSAVVAAAAANSKLNKNKAVVANPQKPVKSIDLLGLDESTPEGNPPTPLADPVIKPPTPPKPTPPPVVKAPSPVKPTPAPVVKEPSPPKPVAKTQSPPEPAPAVKAPSPPKPEPVPKSKKKRKKGKK
ncbi:hypothetical protein BBJ28_00022160 [Nothophytophthora sp. Chile5]|nr:hypothetical protein BBJ28_00022160 [Nothophytophthora sp. Chile5]